MAAAQSYHQSAALARTGMNAVPPRLIAAHHGAQARAEARDRRIRAEDLALGGQPRLRADNMTAVRPTERSGR